MCFSASASFGAGAVLTVIGVATIKKTDHPAQLLFAGIPLLFGIQQIAEGILWLTLSNPLYENTHRIFMYIYLFFAQILWPIWVPIAIMLLEKSTTRKRIQKLLIVAGMIVGTYMAYCLVKFSVEAKIIGQHIKYFQDYPFSLRNYGIALYALATIVPPFFSHIRGMWILGVTILLAYIITAFFFDHYLLSVWCFFSSVISLSIYVIMIEISKSNIMQQQNSYK